jgi:hypothetical protein
MRAALHVNWFEMRRISTTQARRESPRMPMTLEYRALLDENAQLRETCRDLAASNEIWIRLYESALARANGTGDR